MRAYAAAVEEILETCTPEEVPERVMAELEPLLATEDLLAPEHLEPGEDGYRRHVLYADPDGRFTVLALIWRPGQGTSVHGHTAWGAVGVYRGEPNVVCYDCEGATADEARWSERSDNRFGPGAVCSVQPGLDDTHRIYNASDDIVITLHTYGCDLVRDPESINIVLAS